MHLAAHRPASKHQTHAQQPEHDHAGLVGFGLEGNVATIGVGGLGHIGIQVLRALCAAEIIAIDRSDNGLQLAKECGAHHLVKADGNELERVPG